MSEYLNKAGLATYDNQIKSYINSVSGNSTGVRIFTLDSNPTSSTLTYTINNITYNFKIGDEVRVLDLNNGEQNSNYYIYYKLYDLVTENNTTTAYWKKIEQTTSAIDNSGYSDSDNVRMASQIGLIPNDSTKGSANGAIIASLITAGKSLFMDKNEVYYITGGSWEIGYDFSIKGKATIVFSGTVFVPVQGASISFDGIVLKGRSSEGIGTYLIMNRGSIEFVIDKISITDCCIENFTRLISIYGKDIDYAETPLGIKNLTIKDCYVWNSDNTQIELKDIVISDSCLIKDNFIDKIGLSFFIKSDTNTNTYSDANNYYDCDIVVDSNVVTGTVCNANYAYYLFVQVETRKLIYTNNVVSNFIGLYGPAYDMYANCNEIIYENNIVRNVCNLPQTTEHEVYSEIFKTKSAGMKIARNNHWTFDFNECRQLVLSQKGVTYTDERFNEINHVMLFNYTNIVDVEFCGNYIEITGGSLAGLSASKQIRTMLFDSNVIKTDSGMTDTLIPVWNDYTQEVIVKNNVFKTTNTSAFNLFGTPYKNRSATNNVRVVCTGNESNTPIMNIGSAKTQDFVFEGNTYKMFPTTFSNITDCYLGGKEKLSRTEFFIASGYDFRCYSIGNAVTTLHCKTVLNSAVNIKLGNSVHNVDMYFHGLNKVYRLRDENGTINVYDGHNVRLGSIGSSSSTLITEGNMYISGTYSSSVITLNYYNVAGYFDIEIADSGLRLFDGKVSGNVVPIVQASETTLSAEPSKYYRYDSTVTSLAVTLPAISDISRIQSIILSFTTGSSPSVTFTSADGKSIAYASGFLIEGEKNYEINCLFNGLRWVIAYMTIL